jgi:hypothetical protein
MPRIRAQGEGRAVIGKPVGKHQHGFTPKEKRASNQGRSVNPRQGA